MATNNNDNFNIRAPKAIDNRYGVFDSGTWRAFNDTSEALLLITYRYVGLTCLVKKAGLNVEYWFKDNTTTLVEKNTGGESVPSNLSLGTRTATTIPILNSNGTGFTIPASTTTLAGLITSAEKVKLTGIDTAATANQTDAFLLDRANHSGTQAISTITGLQAALDANADNKLSKTVSTTTYTFITGDENRWLIFTNAAGCAITIPNSIFADGKGLQGVQRGVGQLTFTAGSGVTLNKSSLVNAKTATTNSVFGIQFESASICTLFGELELIV